MSQEKVARYKEEKLKRKEIVKKQKRQRIFTGVLVSMIPVALVAVIGLTVFITYLDSQPRPSVDVNYSAVSDFSDKMEL